MSRLFRLLLLVLATWLAGYLAYRTSNKEVWANDGKTYVILPTGVGVALYYLWRPLMVVDGQLTGMQFHIGSHQ